LIRDSMFGKADKTFSLTCAAAGSLAGKHVAVVAGTNGLGRAIARLAASQGSSVTGVGAPTETLAWRARAFCART
jgi:NAD(P)-dependent dehydrogenase (short-subunit alcohol dehydrogenase family)